MRFLLALLLVVAGTCGSPDHPHPGRDQLTGPITEIARGDNGAIESFTLREGHHSYEIRIERGRNYGFDLQHLEEHRVAKWPGQVRLEARDDALWALEILDATRPGGVPA